MTEDGAYPDCKGKLGRRELTDETRGFERLREERGEKSGVGIGLRLPAVKFQQ